MITINSSVKPVKFHPYTSRTTERIFQTDEYTTKEYNVLKKELIHFFNSYNIKAYNDNKIVFECEMYGKRICFGFYDGVFSIGLNYRDENEK